MRWQVALLLAQATITSALLAGYITRRRWWPEAGVAAMLVGLVADFAFHAGAGWVAMNALGLAAFLWYRGHRA